MADEQRIQAYMALIEQLLDCPQGKEAEVWQQANEELLDAGLLTVMEQVANNLRYQGHSKAAWLRGFAALLNQSLETEQEHATRFLGETLQLVADSQGDARQIYPIWTQQQAQLNSALLTVLPLLIARLYAQYPERQLDLAASLVNFGNLIQQFPLGTRWLNLELCIATYEHALQVYTRDTFPQQWAMTQHNLALAYYNRIQGERADNLERAISAYEEALQVRTRDAFPQDWATTQNNLATTYSDRIRGERADNLERAISAYEEALQVYTRDTFPQDWATTQNNLATTYSDRIRGERADNLEQAISAYEEALKVYTRDTFPQNWATTQNNLANAYLYRIRGERADNLERAISAYEHALKVRTRDAFPQDWATTQNNLAIVYSNRIRGEQAGNLEQAISAYEHALQVYTRDAFPQDWARTQNNLAAAYLKRIQGERADNLEQVITACEHALQVYTRDAFPQDWAKTQNNLATAYSERIKGDRADNLEQSIQAFQFALQVFTRDAFPEQWAMTQNNLASAYRDRIQGDWADNLEQSIQAYEQALQVFTWDAFPNGCRKTARNLGKLHFKQKNWSNAATAYETALSASEVLYQACILLDGKAVELAETADLPHHTAYALARLNRLQASVEVLERGRARGLSEILERDRSDLTRLQTTNPDLFNQYQDITTQLRKLEAQQRLWLTSEERYSLTPEALRTEALQLRQALTKTIEQIHQIEGYKDFLVQPDFSDIQQAVRPNVPLVYLVSTPLGSFALVVTTDKVTSIWLDELTDKTLQNILRTWFGAYGEWLTALQSYRNEKSLANLQALKEAEKVWHDAIEHITHQLWQPLMAPLIDQLKRHAFHQAILIPTGYLSLFPLHAAWTEDSTTPTGKRYVLDEIGFTYAPNARSLTAATALAQQATAEVMAAIDNPLKDLPNSSREVAAAIASFSEPKILKHEEATVESVLAVLPDCNILHLSCHGTANLREPLNSGLAMSDGLLTLRQFLDLKLSDQGGIRLAILSACETGLVGTELADEAVSLPTGLLQAGVAGVIASLWSVSDLSTMLLLSKFYELWRINKQEPSEALRQSQLWLRDSTDGEIANSMGLFTPTPDNRSYAHPFHWAAFSYTGV